MQKIDILAFAAHPDDAELSCGGTLAKHASIGKKTGIIDFTKGELGTRGTPEIRMKEAHEASKILGLSVRENLNFRDGFFEHDEKHLIEVVKRIRLYQPDIILANAPQDRHPDHGRAAKIVEEAAFLSGLNKIKTTHNGQVQESWRPKKIFFYIQNNYIDPEIIVDISAFWDIKAQAVLAFSSQFHNSENKSKEPETYISSPEFLDFLKYRAADFGRLIGKKFAEGFTSNSVTGVEDFDKILLNYR